MRKLLPLLAIGSAVSVYAVITITPPGMDTFQDGTKVFREVVDEDFFGTPIPRELRREQHTYRDIERLIENAEGKIVQLEQRISGHQARIAELNWMLNKYPTPAPEEPTAVPTP